MTRPSHHPWINSSNFIRDIALSRLSIAGAARIRINIAKAIGVDDQWLASVLSIRFQEKKGKLENLSCPDIDRIPYLQLNTSHARNVARQCGIDIVRKDVSAQIVDTVFKVIEDRRNFTPVEPTKQVRDEPVFPASSPDENQDQNHDMQDPRDDVPQSDVMPVM